MTDLLDFEARLEGRLRARAALALRPFDAVAIAQQAVATSGRPRVVGGLDRPSIRPTARMLSVGRLALGAAAVVVIVVAGIQFLPRSGTSSGQPSPTPTPTATPDQPPVAVPGGPLAPGRYALYDDLRTSVEVPAGWTGKPLRVKRTLDRGLGLWWGRSGPVNQVFTEVCPGETLTTVDGTVRGLVDALDAQIGTDATITEVTLGGLAATRVDLVQSPDLDLASCEDGADGPLKFWGDSSGFLGLSPGARLIVYVFEKDGEVVVFDGIVYRATANDEAELEAVIASTQFGP